MSYSVLPAGEAFWRPSNQMGVLNTDLAKQLGAPGHRRALLAAAPRAGVDQAPPPRDARALRGDRGRRADPDRRRTCSSCRGCPRCCVSPDSVRQVFNDTDADVLWLVFGAPHEAANTLEMSEETIALLYPDGPKALPPELAADDRPPALHRQRRGRPAARRRTRSRCWSGSRSTSRCRCRRRSWGRSCCASGSARSTVAAVAAADLDPIFRERPAIHRFPGAMATRVHELAVHVLEHYDGRRRARLDRRDDHRRAAREPRGAARVRRR